MDKKYNGSQWESKWSLFLRWTVPLSSYPQFICLMQTSRICVHSKCIALLSNTHLIIGLLFTWKVWALTWSECQFAKPESQSTPTVYYFTKVYNLWNRNYHISTQIPHITWHHVQCEVRGHKYFREVVWAWWQGQQPHCWIKDVFCSNTLTASD